MIIQTPKGSRRCRRCGGSGQFSHGECFNCRGAGFTTPQPKAAPRHTISPNLRAATITAIRTGGAWWGYTYENHYTWDHCPLQNATISDVRRHLMGEAQGLIDRYGADITRW